MKKSTAVIVLIAIFVITLAARLFMAFQTDNFSYEAYFSLRQIENINQFGVPLFDDSLSFNGRSHLFPPFFYYLIAVFGIFGTSTAAKIVPNILASLIIVVVYLISFDITKNRAVSLVCAFFSGFIPVFFITQNDISIYTLVILLLLSILYLFMRYENNINPLLFLLVLLVFTHASSFILVIGLLIYLLLLRIEGFKIKKYEQEIVLFASFLVIWFNFIVYKKALLLHGPLVIWQNIPLQILTNYYFDLNMVQSLYYVGFIPAIFGVYAIYKGLFREKKRPLLLLLGIFLSVLILLWFKLIQFQIGLIFLSFILILLSSYGIKIFYVYLSKTKFSNSSSWFLGLLCLLFVLTAIIPSFSISYQNLVNTPSDLELDAFYYLMNSTANNSVILARMEEGYAINYFANRPTVIDNNFLLVEDSQQRYEDVQSSYSLRITSEVVRRLTTYDVDYVYFSKKFGNQEKLYYVDPNCFDLVFNNSIEIYETKCSIN